MVYYIFDEISKAKNNSGQTWTSIPNEKKISFPFLGQHR